MLNIGCHLSSSKGFTHGEQALSINANTFQFLPEIHEEARQRISMITM